MSARLADYFLLHGDAESPDSFFRSVFAGQPRLTNLSQKYLPENFPLMVGSVISPSVLGLEDNKEYLTNTHQRYRLALRALFAGIADAIRDAKNFDMIYAMKPFDSYFNFSQDLSAQYRLPRFTNPEFAQAIAVELQALGVQIHSDRIQIIDATCASGHVCAGLISRFFEAGHGQRALAIALDLISIERCWFLGALGAAARYEPGESLKGPFAFGRKGFMQSDGAAIAIFESHAAARVRGTRSHSAIVDIYQNSDSETLTAGSRGGVRIEECMAALSSRHDIQAVKAHGTGTPINDANEAAVLNRIFAGREMPVLSLKGQLGHTLAAGGLLEMLVVDEVLRRRQAPPTLNLTEPDPECNLAFIREPKEFSPRNILSNSFGFGGYNACILQQGLDQ